MVSQHSYGKSLMVDVQGTHGFRYSGMTPGLVQRRATGFTTHSINFASSNAPCIKGLGPRCVVKYNEIQISRLEYLCE
jgi:hypothetical protein